MDAVGFKPICCGERTDAELLAAASGSMDVNDVNPVWMRPPVAPYTASIIEERIIDLGLIRETFARLSLGRTIVVEGAGGWLVPVQRDYSMADMAVEFALPVIVVVANKLGCINHTALTVQAIRASGLKCAGLFLNHTAPLDGDPAVITNRAILEDILDVPVLAEIEFGQTEMSWVG
jgi:dethiobiotin synthetase